MPAQSKNKGQRSQKACQSVLYQDSGETYLFKHSEGFFRIGLSMLHCNLAQARISCTAHFEQTICTGRTSRGLSMIKSLMV